MFEESTADALEHQRMPATLNLNVLFQINTQETQLQKAEETITTMRGEMENMRSKIEEALKLIDIAKKLEEKIVSVQHRQDTNADNRWSSVAENRSPSTVQCG